MVVFGKSLLQEISRAPTHLKLEDSRFCCKNLDMDAGSQGKGCEHWSLARDPLDQPLPCREDREDLED